MIKVFYIVRMDNGKIVCHMVEDNLYIQMVVIMLDILLMVYHMVKVDLLVQMVGIIKVSCIINRLKDMVNLYHK